MALVEISKQSGAVVSGVAGVAMIALSACQPTEAGSPAAPTRLSSPSAAPEATRSAEPTPTLNSDASVFAKQLVSFPTPEMRQSYGKFYEFLDQVHKTAYRQFGDAVATIKEDPLVSDRATFEAILKIGLPNIAMTKPDGTMITPAFWDKDLRVVAMPKDSVKRTTDIAANIEGRLIPFSAGIGAFIDTGLLKNDDEGGAIRKLIGDQQSKIVDYTISQFTKFDGDGSNPQTVIIITPQIINGQPALILETQVGNGKQTIFAVMDSSGKITNAPGVPGQTLVKEKDGTLRYYTLQDHTPTGQTLNPLTGQVNELVSTPTPKAVATATVTTAFELTSEQDKTSLELAKSAYAKEMGIDAKSIKTTFLPYKGSLGFFALVIDEKTGIPLMIGVENIKTGEKEWKIANFTNNPYDISFGYTQRIDPQKPSIDNAPASKLFDANAIYTSNQFAPLRNLSNRTEYNGEKATQPSFFANGKITTEKLKEFVDASTSEFKGIKFVGDAIDKMPKGNANIHVMVITGQNQAQGPLEKITDPVVAEEAFVWYLTNSTKAALKNNVSTISFNELIRSDNYWPKAMNKTPAQIVELAIETVRMVAGNNPNIKFMLNDDSIERPGNQRLGDILNIITDFNKRGIVKPSELVIGIQYHNVANYDTTNLDNVVEKLYAAGIRDIRLSEVDILDKKQPTNEQIVQYYKSLIKSIKAQKIAHPDLKITVVLFDEAWGGSYLGTNYRITDIQGGLYQLIAELYK